MHVTDDRSRKRCVRCGGIGRPPRTVHGGCGGEPESCAGRCRPRPPLDSRPWNKTPPHLTIDPETGWPAVKCHQAFTSEDVYRCELDTT